MPAVVALLGAHLRPAASPAPAPLRRAWERVAGRGGGWVVRNAVGAGASPPRRWSRSPLPAASIETGPPSVKLLPASVSGAYQLRGSGPSDGPGLADSVQRGGRSTTKPITDRALLIELDRFQAAVAKDPRVASVVGPGAFRATSKISRVLPRKLASPLKLLKGGKRDLGSLAEGARPGAAPAPPSCAQGSWRPPAAPARSTRARRPQRSRRGPAPRRPRPRANGRGPVSGGLQQALAAARKLRDGAAAALAGSRQITGGLGDASPPVKSGAPIARQMAGDVGSGAQAIHGATSSAAALATQLDAALSQMQAMKTGTRRSRLSGSRRRTRQCARHGQSLQNTLGGAAPKVGSAASVASAFAGQVAKLSTGLQQLYAGSSRADERNRPAAERQRPSSPTASGSCQPAAASSPAACPRCVTAPPSSRPGSPSCPSGSGAARRRAPGGTGPYGRARRRPGQAALRRRTVPRRAAVPQGPRAAPAAVAGSLRLGLLRSRRSRRRLGDGTRDRHRSRSTSSAVGPPARSRSCRGATSHRRPPGLGADLQRRVDAFAARTHTEAAVGGPAGQLGDFRARRSRASGPSSWCWPAPWRCC